MVYFQNTFHVFKYFLYCPSSGIHIVNVYFRKVQYICYIFPFPVIIVNYLHNYNFIQEFSDPVPCKCPALWKLYEALFYDILEVNFRIYWCYWYNSFNALPYEFYRIEIWRICRKEWRCMLIVTAISATSPEWCDLKLTNSSVFVSISFFFLPVLYNSSFPYSK